MTAVMAAIRGVVAYGLPEPSESRARAASAAAADSVSPTRRSSWSTAPSVQSAMHRQRDNFLML